MTGLTKQNISKAERAILVSRFVHNVDELPYLIDAIITAVSYNPFGIKQLAELSKFFIDHNTDFYDLQDFRPKLLRSVINAFSTKNCFPRQTTMPLFLRELIQQGCFTFHEFASVAHLYDDCCQFSMQTKKWIFCIFAQYFESERFEYYTQMLKEFRIKEVLPFYKTCFTNYIEDFFSVKSNDYKIHNNRLDMEFDPYSYASIIERDQDIYLIHQAKGSLFDINQTIEPSIYSRSFYVQNRPSLVQYAAFCRSTKCLKFLLNHNADINYVDEAGNNLMDFAIAGGSPTVISIVEQLYSNFNQAIHTSVLFHRYKTFETLYQTKYLNLTIPDTKGANILQKAIIANNLFVLKFYMNTGMSPNFGYKNGNTALHAAAFYGNLTMCRVLSFLETDINAKNACGRTPLHMAICSASDQVAFFFLSQEHIDTSITDIAGKTPLHIASEYGTGAIVHLLLLMDSSNVNQQDQPRSKKFRKSVYTPTKSPKQMLREIEKDYAAYDNAKNSGLTPLHCAAIFNNVAAVSELLTAFEIEINSRNNVGQTPLIRAADMGHYEVVKVLLENPYIDVNAADELGWTALHSAASRGYSKIIELLLDRDEINVNIKRLPGRTPLHDAADRGHIKTTTLLLAHPNINVNARDDCNTTPLHWAIDRKKYDTAILLLKHPKINVNIQNLELQTPLHWAVERSMCEIVEAMIEHKELKINMKDLKGSTPILIAARIGNRKIVSLLLKHCSIDVTLADKSGQTPFIIASKSRIPEIANMIRLKSVSASSSRRIRVSAK